jgi:hypothetical protein
VLRLELFLINSHQFLPTARIFSKTIVGDPVKPRGKARFPAKTTNVLIGAQECLLRQIIRQSDIRSGKLTQQATHRGLMPPNQLTERVLIIIDKDSCDQVCISQLHGRRLR